MADAKILGLRTVIYSATNLIKTKEWYTKALGIEPYFDEPYYVGFNVGGYELGLDPDIPTVEGSTITYWGVADIETDLKRLFELGATAHTDVQEVGEGIKVAAIKDPFGNVLGLIEDPHFSLA
ncbi:VOC family protein [Spirosoma validum]|uniref:VOC family protein n=1 Tax=Spirosoma validum TaxID=2771355 RepID=A0A927B4J1_9BACT|nr:VOC family protein [Spirosoma validum]MBD2755067.1 VOC family protein [Spirosoma validum]